jgi:hypothetical protein
MSDHPTTHHQPTLLESSLWLPAEHSWRRLPMIGAALAVVGLGGALAFGLLGTSARSQLWHSWLVGSLFVLSLALGALFFVLVHHATQAGWSVVVRRFAENAMATLPFLGLLFAPLLLGMGELFHWSHPEAVATDHLLAHKQPYLNVPFFVLRTVAYFAIWSGLAIWFGRQSRLQDSNGDPEITRRMRRASAPGLILFAVTTTFASFDWLMSLNPHWYSTIFGVYFFAGSMVALYGFLSLVTLAARRSGLLLDVISSEHLHDLGKFLFAFVAFWGYIGFSQFFLIWYGNMPEETAFFALRLQGSWRPASILLAAGHFLVPFFFLLPRTVKRHTAGLAVGASWLLFMHLLDLYWLVMPNLHPEGVAPGILDLAALLGSIGVFLAAFGWSLQRQALVPLRDPRLPESLLFENQ